MKRIAFIGGYDKTDLIIYISKILAVLGKKVLFVDTTLTKKTKYVLPKMGKSSNYITTFERIDIAIGFENLKQIEKYNESRLDYDFIIIDIDSPVNYRNYGISNSDDNFFVTGFDIYSLRKGVNVFKALLKETEVKKIYFSQEMTKEEDEYLNYLTANNQLLKWNSEIIYFPVDLQDMETINQNERMARIKFKGLTTTYLDSLQYIVEIISDEDKSKVKKAMKYIDR
ncbi:MAG: hypothetical protein ACI4UE_05375 [Candidatus Scatovivens sp.]